MKKEAVLHVYNTVLELVTSLPDEFKPQAFQVLFEHELSKIASEPARAKPVSPSTKDKVSLQEALASDLDFSPYNSVLLSGTWAERAAIVLSVLALKFTDPAVSAPDIAEIMKTKIGLPNVHRQNVYRDLKSSKLVIKKRVGKADTYSLSIIGRDFIKSLKLD